MPRKTRASSFDPRSPVLDPLAKEILERFKTCTKHYADWEEMAREDYSFALGDQWSYDDLQVLKEQGRPALTFNRIRPVINIVSGYERENSSRIKVNPEGGEDKIFSEVMDRVLKDISKGTNLDYKIGYWFDDGLYCGKGFIEMVLNYDDDPIRGELIFHQRSPYQVLIDPECLEYDLNVGARYLFKIVRLPRSALKELYPKKSTLIDGFVSDTDDPIENGMGLVEREGTNDDYGNRPNPSMVVRRSEDTHDNDLAQDDRFTVKEYWRYKLVDKYFVINKESGEPERFDIKEQADGFVISQGFGKVITRQVKEMWEAAMVGGHVLQDEKSSFEPYYHGFPFFRFIAEWAPNAEKEVWRIQGMTRPLKDPQREKNKSKSQNLHILNTQANSGWVADDTALSEEGFKRLEKMGSKPGLVVKKKPGTELREILPKGPNQGQIQREQQADEEFKQISSINPDLLGLQEGTASGRAISLRIKQAVLSLVRMFANYRYSKEILGNAMLQMVPMIFDAKKIVKVLGPQYMQKATDPQKYPEGLNEGHIQAFLTMVQDAKYDVYVAEADQNQTIRFEIFQALTDLVKAGLPIPPDLIVEYLDLPNSEEVKQRLLQAQQQQLAALAAKGNGKSPGVPLPQG